MSKSLNNDSARTKLKNLSSLLDTDEDIASNPALDITQITLSPHQPRRYFDSDKMQELITSISQHGVLEPILVRPIGTNRYELVAGERRLKACQALGQSKIPAIVKDLTDQESSLISLVENLQRENLNPVEETEAILQILSLKLNLSPEQVTTTLYRLRHELRGEIVESIPESDRQIIISTFTSLGLIKWETFISHRLPLLNLPQPILEALRTGQIEYTKATAIATVKDMANQQALLRAAITETLSLQAIKERIKNLKATTIKPKPVSLKTRFADSYQKLKKSPIWEDQQKQQQIEELLRQIESLIAEN